VTSRRHEKINQVLSRRQPDLSVLAENVHKPHNLSAIIRSCDAVGVGVVHAVNPTGGVPTYNETSASADKWVELRVHDDLNVLVDELRADGMQILAAHLSDRAVDYRDVDYTLPTVILLGNEKDGVSPRAAALADAHVIIPMLGMVQSLNVSVAAAVILFEAQRQRRDKGFYEAPRLPPAERSRLAYEWLHPREAAILRSRAEPYPDLLDNTETQ
jgi:tRNA (guanosine-2'-O-)-methyltransferase